MAGRRLLPQIQEVEENISLQIQKRQMTSLFENWPCPCCYPMYSVKNQQAKAAQLPLNLPFDHCIW